jgi:4-hydroxybenzoate polyprenyltransferase
MAQRSAPVKPATPGAVAWRRATPMAHLRCIRYSDVLVLQGSPVLGALYALDGLSLPALPRLAVFVVASCMLVAHIFSLNDWAGIAADGNDPNKTEGTFLNRGVSARALLVLSLGLMLGSLVIFAALDARIALVALAIAALSGVYSHPAFDAKGTPIVSSVPHVLGGVLHFLLGYSLFSPIDTRGALIALYFALTFTAGHLNQEVRDYEGDRRNGIRTNAVRFGPHRVFIASFVVFTLAYAHLGVLAATGVVPASQEVVLLLYPLHAFWSLRTLRSGLSFDSVTRLQTRYRLIYGLIGLIMLVTLVAR